MALSKQGSASLDGITARKVTVEVDVMDGLPVFTVVGLADKAVEESRERIRSALKHSGFQFPLARITVNLVPSHFRKSGIHFDLPIALALLAADGQLLNDTTDTTLFVGGLSLDGQLQSVPGVIVLAEYARDAGYKTLVVPWENYFEATLVTGLEVIPIKTLRDAVAVVHGEYHSELPRRTKKKQIDQTADDWLQIQGQVQAKRAAVIAAAGGHNILLEGSPGAGKTLLARGMRALLPPLSHEELIEVVKLQSVAGQLPADYLVDGISRPFRSPHHSASQVSMVGGGTLAKPGEISLAHHGVLFLDELPEFPRPVIEALRQPLEDGHIFVTRIEQISHYPARFILVATMNPCPCGWLGSGQKDCNCTSSQIDQYQKKMSGPILDRIDLRVHVPPVTLHELQQKQYDQAELDSLRQLVAATRQLQLRRNKGLLNAKISSRSIDDICPLTDDAQQLISQAAGRFVLTGRGYHKLLKVARTIADLAGQEQISSAAIAEALQYRFAQS